MENRIDEYFRPTVKIHFFGSAASRTAAHIDSCLIFTKEML
ncbi:MAG: hypothetical protein K0S28_1052 [Paucimonas sp.]|nr:hypothetical protein [Paucimonas sp.]